MKMLVVIVAVLVLLPGAAVASMDAATASAAGPWGTSQAERMRLQLGGRIDAQLFAQVQRLRMARKPSPRGRPDRSAPAPPGSESPPPTTTPISHGSQITADNTGLRGAGYVYDSTTDSFTHPDHGPLRVIHGSLTTTHDGQVIDGVEVHGMIKIHHRDVVVRNCRVRYSGELYAIDALRNIPDHANALIEFCDVEHTEGPDISHQAMGIALRFGTIRRANVHGVGGGITLKPNDSSVHESYVHDLTTIPGGHSCGIAADGGGSDYAIVRNRVEGGSTSNVCLFARTPFDGVLVEGNVLDGPAPGDDHVPSPSYCLNAGDNKNGVGLNVGIEVVGNRFGRTYSPKCGQYGPYYRWDGSRPGARWCDNRWLDTEETIGDESGCE